MGLSILKSTDPVSVDTLITVIYGDPGAGKTSLGFTARDPLLLDFDRGAHRSHFRGDSVPIDEWDHVASMGAADLKPYRTIVVDTVGRCLDAMSIAIIRDDPKMKTRTGQLTRQGYGSLKVQFAGWMRELRSYGKDVVLIAHGVEKNKGDDLIMRPDITGSSYGEVFKCADAVGYLFLEGKRRTLAWDPQDRYVGKNPANLDPVEVPNLHAAPHYLGELIDKIKAEIGQISRQAEEIRAEVDSWRAKIDEAKSAKALTDLVELVNGDHGPAVHQVKVLIARRAKELAYTWDKESEKFLTPKQAEKVA